MITVDVRGMSSLVGVSKLLMNLKPIIMEVIEHELWEYAKILKQDNTIPEDYRNALDLVVAPELDVVALMIVLDLPQNKELRNRFLYERFGDRMDYAIYTCPRRGYAGGKLVKEYTGPSYMREHWETYKSVFLNKVKAGIRDKLKGGST